MSPYLDPPVNAYDPASRDLEPQTMPLDIIIRNAIKAALLGVRVCIPAQVTKVLGNQTVNVQPGLQTRYIDQSSGTDLPQIQNVPVSMPMGSGYSIKLPVAEGDTGYLIFSDRSLDAWLAGSGSSVDPQDSRAHDLSDAIFVPGLVTTGAQTEDDTTDLIITNGDAVAKFQAAGTFLFKNMSNELMDLLDQTEGQLKLLAKTLSTDTVNTLMGPMQLNAFETYQQISNTVAQIQANLETLKGS